MDVIEHDCTDKQLEFTNVVRLISALCSKLLNIYKTEFVNQQSPLDFLYIIPGFQDLLEISLIISKKFIEPEYNKRFNQLYQEFYQDYQKHAQLYLSFKHGWIKLLDIIGVVEPKKRATLVYVFNNLLDYLQQQKLLYLNQELLSTNLLYGIKNFLTDLVYNNGYFNIKNNDLNAFKVGKNIAVTRGKVIYKNYLIELIEYSAATETVYKIPILIIPPCINKYYILDLSSNNSLVKWLVEQGFVVYIISWRNPDQKHANTEFADYVIDGALTAIKIINNIVGHKQIHTVGYCIGGTILGCLLSYIKQIEDIKVLSATHFMSLLDFSDIGELGIFLNLNNLNFLEKNINNKGYLDGRILSMAFNALRPNDLIWPYFINNCLLNKPLQAFDILYWNSDPTNLPANMYKFYLKQICYNNLLCKPNGIKIKNIGIDLNKIKVPVFMVAGEKDHITPCRAVYASSKLYSGHTQFILANSGHVKGLINPPADNKYSYKVNIFNKKLPKNFNTWLKNAIDYPGSWWPYWQRWLLNINNEQLAAKDFHKLKNNHLADAPGSYVLERL